MIRNNRRDLKAVSATFLTAALTAFVSACSSLQGDVQAGRRDLLYGDPALALARFERVADRDPDYVSSYSILREGVWTYVGRAHYAAGRLPEARRALERSLAHSSDDNLARLYLGLVLLREGDRQRGIGEVERGLRGVHGWLDDIERRFAFSRGRFWDPSREIRSRIESDLAMIARGPADWQKVLVGGEWVGYRMEEEMDRARRDETDELFREGEDRNRR